MAFDAEGADGFKKDTYCQAASSLRGSSSSLESSRVCHLMNANVEFARDSTVDGDFTPIAALTMSNIAPGDALICFPTMRCSNDDPRKRDHFVTAAFISASLISWKDCSRIALTHLEKAGCSSGPDYEGFELSVAMVETGTCVTASSHDASSPKSLARPKTSSPKMFFRNPVSQGMEMLDHFTFDRKV